MRKIRIFLGILILTVSLALLIWSFWPVERQTRVQPIAPAELTLPTPQSHLFGPFDFAQGELYPAA